MKIIIKSIPNKYSAGGSLNSTQGMDINKNLVSFNASGTHEENPNGGILQGTGANGQPNLVEEGETKHEDYIFSDRLKVNPQISKDFKLPAGLNGKTFAQASKYLNREAKDRPNDPISNNGVKAHLAKLTAAQEGLKEQMQPQQQGIPMEGQPDGNILAQGYANGGYVDQTHYQNPTLQGANIGAMGGNIYDGTSEKSSFMDLNDQYVFDKSTNFNGSADAPSAPYAYHGRVQTPWNESYFPFLNDKDGLRADSIYNNNTYNPLFKPDVPKTGVLNQGNPNQKAITDAALADIKKHGIVGRDESGRVIEKPGLFDKLGESMQGKDFSRYAPVAANMAMGINDMFEKPEVVKYGRVNPERITARMDYQPVDTEWMNNKMNATYAGTRDQMINNAGGNRAIAMAGLSGINQQQQNALGEAYMKAQDINYGRKNQATQFNAGIEAQNVAAQNAAQQANLQLQMQEMDANARNRAAKRNAARQAILNAANNVGDIGRENYFGKLTTKATGYNPMDALKYSK